MLFISCATQNPSLLLFDREMLITIWYYYYHFGMDIVHIRESPSVYPTIHPQFILIVTWCDANNWTERRTWRTSSSQVPGCNLCSTCTFHCVMCPCTPWMAGLLLRVVDMNMLHCNQVQCAISRVLLLYGVLWTRSCSWDIDQRIQCDYYFYSGNRTMKSSAFGCFYSVY